VGGVAACVAVCAATVVQKSMAALSALACFSGVNMVSPCDVSG
jgi:hypothetical protein